MGFGEDVGEQLLVGIGAGGAEESTDDSVAFERSGRLPSPCPEQVGQLSVGTTTTSTTAPTITIDARFTTPVTIASTDLPITWPPGHTREPLADT